MPGEHNIQKYETLVEDEVITCSQKSVVNTQVPSKYPNLEIIISSCLSSCHAVKQQCQ